MTSEIYKKENKRMLIWSVGGWIITIVLIFVFHVTLNARVVDDSGGNIVAAIELGLIRQLDALVCATIAYMIGVFVSRRERQSFGIDATKMSDAEKVHVAHILLANTSDELSKVVSQRFLEERK